MKAFPVYPPASATCRIGGLAWIPNEHGHVLTLSVNYVHPNGDYQLPGGVAKLQQSSLDALVSHARHEIGVSLKPVRLLGTDWMPHAPSAPTVMEQNFVYLCDVVPADTKFALPDPVEGADRVLSGYLWQTPRTAELTMRPYQFRRFVGLWQAWRENDVAVLHAGRPALFSEAAGVSA
ncbi:hypothetical protein ACFV97_25815 [Streptomyces sp. NPDC059913]|uniref:hypothetical protein n=1 Tax=unclassified Streptomyces TaxID=2593676 RepID=UPI003658FD30